MNKRIARWVGILLGLSGLVVAVGLLALCTGSAGIPIRKIPEILLKGTDSAEYSILMGIRLPRILLAMS
ncbi:MAG: iron ABC transporter permease, partial [Deltaproteobacteria bacterium]